MLLEGAQGEVPTMLWSQHSSTNPFTDLFYVCSCSKTLFNIYCGFISIQPWPRGYDSCPNNAPLTRIFSVRHITRMLRCTNQTFSPIFGDNKKHTYNTQKMWKTWHWTDHKGDFFTVWELGMTCGATQIFHLWACLWMTTKALWGLVLGVTNNFYQLDEFVIMRLWKMRVDGARLHYPRILTIADGLGRRNCLSVSVIGTFSVLFPSLLR